MSEELSLYHYYLELARPAPIRDRLHYYILGRELGLSLIENAKRRLEYITNDFKGKSELRQHLQRFRSELERMPAKSFREEDFQKLARTLLRLHTFLKRFYEEIGRVEEA